MAALFASMRIAIATVQVPFITGGAEILATSLQRELRARGHEAEIVTTPFKWYPPERILDCMLMGRLVDVTEVNGQRIDRVIALKFPVYYLDHPDKVCWILHQHRQAYDLFETEYGDLHQSERGRKVADEIRRWDNVLLPKSRGIFAISRTVTDRLRRYNGITGTPLYHPPVNFERYHCAASQGYVLYPGRFDAIKRQHLLVEAMARVKSPIRAVFIGNMSGVYGNALQKRIAELGLQGRVDCLGAVDEDRKIDLYAHALAIYNGVYDEDYGYLTLEAFFASKPVITHMDSGGPMEFVRDEENGFVTRPDAEEIAARLDLLYGQPSLARVLGERGRLAIDAMGISWENVAEHLLA
jgi:glycosyltransferase involved in cell wall biosynthesis